MAKQWIKLIGGTADDTIYGVAFDGSGNAYASGYVTNNLINANTATDFIGSVFSGMTSTASRDIFVSKFNSTGTQQWIKKMGGNDADDSWGLATDANSNVYVTGRFVNTLTDTNTVVDFANNTLLGRTYDIYFAKLNSSGVQQWIKAFGGTSYEFSRDIQVNPTGVCYIGGDFMNDSANSTLVTDVDGNTVLGKTSTVTTVGFIYKYVP